MFDIFVWKMTETTDYLYSWQSNFFQLTDRGSSQVIFEMSAEI